MESMSRERRPFHALEVDDDEAYSRLLKSRRDSRLQSKRPENDSLRWLIPGLSCLCADDSLRVSYEDLEERFFGLEERHSALQNSAKQAQEQAAEAEERCSSQALRAEEESNRQSTEIIKSKQESARLIAELAASSACNADLQREITGLQERVEEATTNSQRCQRQLLSCEADLRASQDQEAELEAHFSEVQAEHSAAQEHLQAKVLEARRDTQAVRDDLGAAREVIQSLQTEVEQCRQESADLKQGNGQLREELAKAERDFRKFETDLRQSRVENSSLTSALQEAESRASGLGAALEEAKAASSALDLSMQKARAEASDLREALVESREEASQSNTARQKAEAETSRVASSLAEAEAETSRLKTALEESTIARSKLDTELNQADLKAEGVKRELKKAKQESISQRNAKEEAVDQTSTLQQEVHDLRESVRQLEKSLAERMQQVEEYEVQIAQQQSLTQATKEAQCQDQAADMLQPAKLESNGPNTGANNIWDSAADIAVAQGRGPETPAYEELGELFRDRESWRHVIDEGRAAEWLLDMQEVRRGEVLGEGSFGKTYLGSVGSQTVAVKCVRIKREIDATSFLRELSALARIRHANVMTFIGAVLQPPTNCWLVVEYLPGGTLKQWLYGTTNRNAPKRSMVEKATMALEIAKGMLALEATSPPIMHRDLKPDNVLLTEAGTPKIADFGLCREHIEDEAYTYTGETGSYIYMSPEMMRAEIYDSKTDVYSYAILLIEILKQRPPFEDQYLTPVQVAEAVAYDQLRPTLPTGLPGGMSRLIDACLCGEPVVRPDFSTIVGHMSDIVKSLPPPRRGLW